MIREVSAEFRDRIRPKVCRKLRNGRAVSRAILLDMLSMRVQKQRKGWHTEPMSCSKYAEIVAGVAAQCPRHQTVGTSRPSLASDLVPNSTVDFGRHGRGLLHTCDLLAPLLRKIQQRHPYSWVEVASRGSGSKAIALAGTGHPDSRSGEICAFQHAQVGRHSDRGSIPCQIITCLTLLTPATRAAVVFEAPRSIRPVLLHRILTFKPVYTLRLAHDLVFFSLQTSLGNAICPQRVSDSSPSASFPVHIQCV